MIRIQSLNNSSQFQEILKKKKLNNNYFTIYFGKNILDKKKNTKSLNISFVIKKKIGGAVKWNKIKRKLKSAVQKILANDDAVNLNYTYLIFGKERVYSEKFSAIFNETSEIFNKIKKLNH